MSTVSLIIESIFGHLGHFDKIFRSSKGHFSEAISSLNFKCHALQGLSLKFDLFEGYSIRYS